MTEKFSIAEKFAAFAEHWRPRVVGEFSGQELRVVKLQGEFPWHFHEDCDELFIVWKGDFRVEFRDRIERMQAGDALIVPRGIEHRTAADEGAEVLYIAPSGARNTGNVKDHVFTAPDGVRM